MEKHLLALSLAVLCPAVLGILNYGAPSAGNGIGMTNVKNLPGPTHGASPALAPEAMPGGKSPSTPPLPDRAMRQAEITQLLNQVLTVLRGGDAAAISQALAQLDEVFAGKHHDTGAGIAAILAFLESGQDAATGEGFLVGAGGILTEATTLRVFLMDQLGSLSREAGSPAALEVARSQLSRPGSADEWAVSMRNVAWFDPNSREFLADRVSTMLQNEPWRRNPSPGMLEAFNLIVHTGALNTVPELNRLITLEDSPLSRAAGVALDRLASTNPLGLTTLLNQNPQLFATTPLQRADLFAHADLTQPDQRQQAEAYLLRPDVTAAEREKFPASLVQSGQFVSHNPVTPYTPPETPAAAGSRPGTLSDTLSAWLADDRFAGFRSELSMVGSTVNQIHDEMAADPAHPQK